MSSMTESGKNESILGHAWAMLELWFLLRRHMPELNKVVDSLEIYEIILNHDLGETFNGDVSLYQKVNGQADDKDLEEAAIFEILKDLPQTQKEVTEWFHLFESAVKSMTKLEVLVAKWIDNLQGNHYALTFGEALPEHSEIINRILQIRFVDYTNRLLGLLQEMNLTKAAQEVEVVAKVHTRTLQAAGIEFEADKLNVNL